VRTLLALMIKLTLSLPFLLVIKAFHPLILE
jgi:hypothetical protein